MIKYCSIFEILNIKVSCVISSEKSSSGKIDLKDNDRTLFTRGAIDSFIILHDG
jgi:hypothetical protein